MTPSNIRRTLLATSAMATLGALAALTVDISAARADCPVVDGVMVCEGPDTSGNINSKIGAQPGPGLNLTFTTTSKVDTAVGGDVFVGSTKFGGKIDGKLAVVNNGQIGLTDPDGKPTSAFGFVALGNRDAAGNTVTFTNNGTINRLILQQFGGTATVVLNKGVQGQVTIESVGDSSLTLNKGETISGPVTVQSFAPSKFENKVTVDAATTTTTNTTTRLGGSATAVINGDVGAVNKLVPEGFTGQTVNVTAQKDASLTLGGRSGSVFVQTGNSGNFNIKATDTKVVDKTGAFTTASETVNTLAAGKGSLTLLEGSTVFGTANVTAAGGASVDVNGAITGVGTGLFVNTNAFFADSKNSSQVDDKGITRVSNATTVQRRSDADVSLKIGSKGAITGAVVVQTGGALGVDLAGTTGALDLRTINTTGTSTTDQTRDAAGTLRTSKTSTTVANNSETLTLVVAEGAKINGNILAVAGGASNLAVNGAVTGNLNGSYFTTNVSTKADVFDDKGNLTARDTTFSNGLALSGDQTFTLGAAGVVDGLVSVFNVGKHNSTIAGQVGGSLSVGSGANILTQGSQNQTFDTAGGLLTQKTTTTTTPQGGAVTVAIAQTAVVKGATGVFAVGTSDVAVAGKLLGGLTVFNQRFVQTVTTDFATSKVTDKTSSTTTTNNSSATTRVVNGAANTLKIAATAEITGATTVSGDGAVNVSNAGVLKGGLTASSQRPLTTSQTANDSKVVTTAGVTTTETITSGSSFVDEQVGGVTTVDNTGQIRGDVKATGAAGVIFNNSGAVLGNVTLASSGDKLVTTFANGSKVTTTATDGKDLANGITSTTVTNASTAQTRNATGGAVTSKISGTVGVDNASLAGVLVSGVTPGTDFVQTANGASTVDLTASGRLFTNLASNAFSNARDFQFKSDSTLVEARDKLGALVSSNLVETSSTTDNTKLNAGATSTVTISGVVDLRPGDVASNVTSNGQSGSTVTLAGGTVRGSVSSNAGGATTTFSTAFARTTDVKNGADTKTNTVDFSQTTSNSSKRGGGSAGIVLTGAAAADSLFANGDAGASVNVGAAANVKGNVGAQSFTGDSTSSTSFVEASKSTFVVKTGATTSTLSQTTKTVETNGASAINGAATVVVDGKVGGNVDAFSSRGKASVSATGEVVGGVFATSNGQDLTRTTTDQFDSKTAAGLTTSTRSFVQDTVVKSTGGQATVSLAANSKLAAAGATQVAGFVQAFGHTSAQVDVAAGSKVGGGVFAFSDGFVQSSKVSNAFVNGALSTTDTSDSFTVVAGSATVNNKGVVVGSAGAFATGTAAVTNSGKIGGSLTADALNANSTVSLVGIGLLDPVNGKETRTETRTAIGGAATVANTGSVNGTLFAAGATGTVSNAAGASAGAISVGQGVDNWTRTTVKTATSTTDTVTALAMFKQAYTVNQSGLLTAGIFVGGATVANPIAGQPALKTSDISATINLNEGSVTLGPIAGQIDAAGQALTTTDVNLVGSGFLGYSKAAFGVVPTLTGDQAAFINALFGTKIDNVVSTASIRGVRNVVKSGAGTFYILGSGFNDNGTATPADDLYDIKASSLSVTGGRLVLATMDPTKTFSIFGNVSNTAELVLGNLVTIPIASNLDSLLNNSRQIVIGQNFRIDGNFSQGTGGSLTVGITPDLVRRGPLTVQGASVAEALGFADYQINAQPFTLASKSTIPTSTPTSVRVNGDLKLGGGINLAVNRGALYANGTATPLFTVTGTTDITGATVTPMATSNFVGFNLQSSKVGSETVVSIVTQRTSYATAATTANSRLVAGGLDSAVTPTINAIRDDAKGTSVFGNAETFRQVQDVANVISGFDWYLNKAQVGAALDELATSDVYGTVALLSPSRHLNDAFSAFAYRGDRPGDGSRFWVAPVYQTTDFDGDPTLGVTSLRADSWGVVLGSQFAPTEEISAGFGLGYVQADLEADAKPVAGEVASYLLGANVLWNPGSWTLSARVSAAWSEYETSRGLPSFARVADADFDGSELTASIEVGYDITSLPGTLTPFGAVNFRDVDLDGFDETDAGGIGLRVGEYSESSVSPQIGVRWSADESDLGVFSVRPRAVAAYSFSGDLDTLRSQSLLGGGTAYELSGVEEEDYLTLGVGLSGRIGRNGIFTLDAEADVGDSRSSVGIRARAAWGF